MKSLEIVNKLLEKINQYDDWFLTEDEAEQIKQDLEILEILAKYLRLQMLPCMEDTPKVKAWLREYYK